MIEILEGELELISETNGRDFRAGINGGPKQWHIYNMLSVSSADESAPKSRTALRGLRPRSLWAIYPG